MKSAVVVFPGINRERDMARALRLASGREPAMVWHAETALPAGTDLVVIPGGFSYGDYLRCGAIAARAPIMDAVRGFAAKGGLVLGDMQRFSDRLRSRLAARRTDAQCRNFVSSAATSICGSSAPIRHSRAATMPAR